MTQVMDDEEFEDANESMEMIKSRKSEKSVTEQKENKDINIVKHSSEDLAMIRTYLACERTFLASTRTNAIFAGLSLLLSNNGEYIPAMVILSLCILGCIVTSYFFYNSSYKSPHLKGVKDVSLHLASPMFYSVLLMAVLAILLYVTVEAYLGNKVP